ncbi:MAG: TetR family transcriptional regulator C-terminal domain-containing protein [Thermomicrobiales bacterium]
MTMENYREQGYMGCLIGGLGQELSGISEVFRQKVEECFAEIAARIAVCLEDARLAGRYTRRFRYVATGEPAR